MPYYSKGKCVYKKDTDKKVGCTEGPVKKYLAALYAAENKKKKKKKLKESFEEIKDSREAGGLTYKHTSVLENKGKGKVTYGLSTKTDNINVELFYSWSPTTNEQEAPDVEDIIYIKGIIRDLGDNVNKKGFEFEGEPETSIPLLSFIRARQSKKHKLNLSPEDISMAVVDGHDRIIEWFPSGPHMESFEFEKLFDKILNS